MIVVAHVMGVPVEEILVPLASGAGAGTVMWLAAIIRGRHAVIRRRHDEGAKR